MLLTLNNVGKHFGGLQALQGISFEVQEGQIYGIIGPNGAGKTTLFNLITGVFSASEGEIQLAGTALNQMAPHRIVEMGIARTFQNIRLFGNMTVLENILVGQHWRLQSGLLSALFQTKQQRLEEEKAREEAREILALVGLSNLEERRADTLAYGQQRRLEIARALATNPKLLLLDEPAAGMNDSETVSLRELIRRIGQEGVTVLLIEHDMNLVMSVCDRLVVLNFGRQIAEGTPTEIRNHPEVVKAYLGEEEEDAKAM